MAKPTKADVDALKKVEDAIGESETYHRTFLDKVERSYNAYRGVMEKRSEAAAWTSKLHPPYAHQIAETILANVLEEKLRFRVRLRPRKGDIQELVQLREGADALETLLNFQLEQDKFNHKQRTFVLQSIVAGMSVGKNYWRYKEDKLGRVVRSDPCFDPVDVRGFIWPEASTSINNAPWIGHRVFRTIEDLKQAEERGIYKNVKELSETRSGYEHATLREQRLYNADITKGRVEVVEWWNPYEDKLIVIGNSSVVLRNDEYPFDFSHLNNPFPFVVVSSQPDLFMMPGISEIEIIAQLQEMLWTLINQRIDTITLTNNAIMLIRSDVDDPDEFEFGPGERWIVESADQVKWFEPNPQVGNISLASEELLKGDIQNITGGMPFLSGASSQEIDQKTATGVSIITSLAQKRLNHKKQQFLDCYENVIDQWVALNASYLEDGRIVEILGEDGAMDYYSLSAPRDPTMYKAYIEPVQESIMRSERRAEAQALFTSACNTAALMASVGTPWNLQAFADDLLKAFDKDDRERYFSLMPAMPNSPGQQGTQGGQTNGQFPGPQPASPLAPSNANSLSGAQFMQQALAMRGGQNNTPNGGGY